MKVKIMNSAVMPKEGMYILTRISKQEFISLLKEAYDTGIAESFIGYKQNIDLIKEWAGIELEINRNETSIEKGDVMLIMKLKKRLDNPTDKGKVVFNEDDFEFYVAKYN